jgi:hypothetical protein
MAVTSIALSPTTTSTISHPTSTDTVHAETVFSSNPSARTIVNQAHPADNPQNQAACAPLDGMTACNAAPLLSPATASQPTNPSPYPDYAPRLPTPYRDALLRTLHAQDSSASPTTASLPARAAINPTDGLCLMEAVGEPQEEGVMSTAASFLSVRNQGLIDQ